MGRIDCCRKVYCSTSHPQYPLPSLTFAWVTQGRKPAETWGWLYLAPGCGQRTWTGDSSSAEVWTLFSRDMMWIWYLSWWSCGCVVVAVYFFNEWMVLSSTENDMGHFLCITVALRSEGRSLWSSCQWFPWSLGKRCIRYLLGTSHPDEYVMDGGIVYGMLPKIRSVRLSFVVPCMGHSGLFGEHSGRI